MSFQPEFDVEPSSEPRIPTCVNAFDDITKGGLPIGSLVLLLGEVGSGHLEFAHTSAARLSLVGSEETYKDKYLLDGYGHHLVFPKRTVYVSFSRSEEDVLRGFRMSFAPQYYEAFRKNLVFKDLSMSFFKRSPVPSSWVERKPVLFGAQGNGESVLEGMVEFLDREAGKALVIVDSLTDVLHSTDIDISDVVYMLRGLQRASKQWGSLVYVLLTAGVTEERLEKTVSDICDGVLVFGWYKAERGSYRRRYMEVTKFTGVLPHLDQQRVSRFLTDVRMNTGFVVANMERI